MGDQQIQEGIRSRGNDVGLELPPGFRFHPIDEEIITFYLIPKVRDSNFAAVAIGEANLNKYEPWDSKGWQKWGKRRSGKDKEIYQAGAMMPTIIGMKKTLVFYKGRAPKGEKTDCVMHEFRLEGSGKIYPTTSSNSITTKEEWVICKLSNKGSKNNDPPMLPFHEAMANDEIDEKNMTFADPTQVPMVQDCSIDMDPLCPLMDPTMPFYSTIGASSYMDSGMSPMVGMDTLDFDGI
ncbi:hypothetical protein PR202_gb21007 [Eleusine coracana subsp. coracana]|uniref:NAC domain-containing protein n=1 Tax=Eleusine coracana subsp. coracana TaxID=191504 RepID=A0AAV5FC83_ELECO|nr:hypothetical protein PR202_gb21007 [Eleusine coracana subsp. coracana]